LENLTPGPAPASDAPPDPVQTIVPASPVTRAQLAIICCVLAFLVFVSVGVATQLLSLPFGLWWSELFIFFGIPYVALTLSGRAPFRAVGMRKPWLSGAVFGFALGVTNFFAVVAPMMFLSQKIAPKWLLELYNFAKVFEDKPPVELAFIVLGVCIAAPLCEEFFFRGVVQLGLNQVMSPPVAILVTGAIFSAFHLDPVGFIARWELGIVFGLLVWRTGSLWPGIFLHLANNATTTALYFLTKDQTADPTDDATTIAAISGIGGLALLAVIFVARRFPGTFEAPARAEEVRITPNRQRTLGFLFGAAGLSIALLLAIDFRGSVVNAIDSGLPVKNPSAELKAQRDAALKGDLTLSAYGKARSQFGLRRETSKPDAGRSP
jgi:membrane protease YdiL (CAAX protease family)